MLNRMAGVLMHISSLPGPYGIGTLGQEARDFAALLARMGFSAWQVLPLSPPALGDSPYTSTAAFPGNPSFIHPGQLLQPGLLTAAQADEARDPTPGYAVDYGFLARTRPRMLRQAYAACSPDQLSAARDFAKEQAWLPDYALFTVLKDRSGGLPWWQWPDEGLRLHRPEALRQALADFREEVEYHYFVQYCFFTQWQALKSDVNDLGIGLIGDMPIYVALDSADAWSHSELFDLDEEHLPRSVAGVPPDYFAAEGQLWGNPLYDWQAMAQDGYAWWVSRIGWALSSFDAVRIDHFRGFAAYWAVPSTAKTAVEGAWRPGPGLALFQALEAAYPNAAIIAEDLGDVDASVHALRQAAGFPGMAVLQFAFQGDEHSPHLPHNMTPNTIAYTGTHDNNTTLGWLWELSPSERQDALSYAGFEDGSWGEGGPKAPAVRALLRTLYQSPARVAMAPIQDLLGYGGDTRMNIPGVAEGNWRFRVTPQGLSSLDVDGLRQLCQTYRRQHPFGRS